MGFHIYIEKVVEKPVLTPRAERPELPFWSVGESTEQNEAQMEAFFASKFCRLFNQEGYFHEECPHEVHGLPFVRVKHTTDVFCRKADFAAYLANEASPESAQSLLDFFIEGEHMAWIS